MKSQEALLSRPIVSNVSKRLSGYLPLTSTCPSLLNVNHPPTHRLSVCEARYAASLAPESKEHIAMAPLSASNSPLKDPRAPNTTPASEMPGPSQRSSKAAARTESGLQLEPISPTSSPLASRVWTERWVSPNQSLSTIRTYSLAHEEMTVARSRASKPQLQKTIGLFESLIARSKTSGRVAGSKSSELRVQTLRKAFPSRKMSNSWGPRQWPKVMAMGQGACVGSVGGRGRITGGLPMDGSMDELLPAHGDDGILPARQRPPFETGGDGTAGETLHQRAHLTEAGPCDGWPGQCDTDATDAECRKRTGQFNIGQRMTWSNKAGRRT